MNSDTYGVLKVSESTPADLTEIVRKMQAIEQAYREHGGTHELSLLPRPVLLRMLAKLRKELQAVRKARATLERLAQSRERKQRRALVPSAGDDGQRPAEPPALFVVQRSGTL